MRTPPPNTRSAGVTTAATLAMLGSGCALLVWGWLFIGLLELLRDPQGTQAYLAHPTAFFSMALVPPLLIASGIRMGIGLFQLKPWARKAALLWAIIALVFSLSMIAFRPYQTFVIPEHFVSETDSLKQLLAVAMLLSLFPVSVWWIFYFTRPGVKLQFQEANPANPPLEPH
jgi:hypothetical protein